MTTTTTRLGLRVTGVVQGVGFRPFVHRLAHELGLAGHVGNDHAGVFVEVEGPEPVVHEFARRLRDDAPPLAQVTDVVLRRLPTEDRCGFVIVPSPPGGPVATLVPPDVGICDDCRRELFDPDDRRSRHPFITCTNCGPRFTITRSLPYDRPNTTMAGFVMCARCAGEYEDPADRRFHAQPIACPDCGPTLRYEHVAHHDLDVEVVQAPMHGTEPALLAAQRCLAAGGVVAVKGIGGFHLACDATDPVAVGRLRARKQRPHKPFAIMVADVEMAHRVVRLDPEATAALTSAQRPVVLAPARRGASTPGIVPAVAPGQATLGVMLPSSPLHELLLAAPMDPTVGVPPVLIMTSGNVGGEPICFADDDVHARLGRLVDGVLTHDRPIHVPCDDGVVTVIDGVVVPIRRSRGDAPLPLQLPCEAPPTLAVGAELKNTVGIAAGRQAWLSQHIGDLGSLETQRSFERTGGQLAAFFGIDPEVVAADPHPGYATHAWARRVHRDRLEHVQHHHAHVAALLAEHDLAPDETVVGVAFDGTGYGPDGTVWGGEVLLADQRDARRVAHLAVVPLPGGDSAVANPARMALAHLWAAGLGWDPRLTSVSALTASHRRLLDQQLTRDVACVPTSSMGRLFDAVASLAGVCQHVTYEGQAAIELEALATLALERPSGPDDAPDVAGAPAAPPAPWTPTYRFAIRDGDPLVIDPAPVLAGVVSDAVTGIGPGQIAVAFHLAVVEAVVAVAVRVANSHGPRTVGLTGGVFQNALLTTSTRARLEQEGLTVLTHRLVPPNDGGLAFGQLAVVAARAARDDDRPRPPTSAP